MDLVSLRKFAKITTPEDFRHFCLFGSIPEPFPRDVILKYPCFEVHNKRTLIKDLYPGTLLAEMFSENEARLAIEEGIEWLGLQNFDDYVYNYHAHDSFTNVIQNTVIRNGVREEKRLPFLDSIWLNNELRAKSALWFVFYAWDTKAYPEGFVGFLGDKPKVFSGAEIKSLDITNKEYLRYMDILIEDEIKGYHQTYDFIYKRISQCKDC